MSGIAGIYSLNKSFIKNDELVEALYETKRFIGHLGEAATGVLMVDGSKKVKIYRGFGPVKVATPFELLNLMSDSTTYAALAHMLYSKDEPKKSDIQPSIVESRNYRAYVVSDSIVLGHKELRSELESDFKFHTDTNGEVLAALFLKGLENAKKTKDQKEIAVKEVFDATRGRGGYSVEMLLEEKDKGEMELVAFRDETGLTPLCHGCVDDTYFVLSETYPLERYGVGLDGLHEIKPGSIFWVSRNEEPKEKQVITNPKRKSCGFHPVYFGGPDARILTPLGPLFKEILPKLDIRRCDSPDYKPTNFTLRACLGWLLKDLYPDTEADMVIPIPETGKGVATGLSAAFGLPYRDLLPKTYAFRTYLHPPRGRSMEVRTKLKAMIDWVFGKRVIGADDSIVKAGMSGESEVGEGYEGGHSAKKRGMIDLILNVAGAEWLGLAVSYPPMPFPCFADFKPYDEREPRAAERMFGMSRKEINKKIAEKLKTHAVFYQSLDNVHKVLGCNFCTACTDGNYPVDPRFVYDWVKADLKMAEERGLLY